jgi:DNA-binding NarL/FixJ family response regulator
MSDIAFTLKVKPFTIQNAAKRVYSKMGVTNRTELFAQRIATLEAEVTAAQRG